jgi:peptide/nickel transport system substrate-binding protein
MVDGHVTEDDGRRWTMRLRDGLRFHDGEPVRGRDVVASFRRWAARDGFGQAVAAALDEIAAPDDRTIAWRFRRPFPLLPDALGKIGSHCCFIMPERHAVLEPAVAIPEVVGSGPFRFNARERVAGSRVVYEKFDGYVPRAGGTADLLAGPKVVNIDRVEWLSLPDPATAAAALRQNEIEWWEQPTTDLLALLRRARGVKVEVLDRAGACAFLRFNHLQPPFDDPAARRAMLPAISQTDIMTAVAGTDRDLWRDDLGFFLPGSVMASDEGMAALTGPRDIGAARAALAAAGRAGARVTFPVPTDFAVINAMSQVVGDTFARCGLQVDTIATDWGSVLRRIASQETPERGGWSCNCTYTAGVNQLNPAAHNFLRGHGRAAAPGWPTSPGIEAGRDAWFLARDDAERARIGREIQRHAFNDLPYIPLGLFYQPTAYRDSLSGVLNGLPLFWNLRKA